MNKNTVLWAVKVLLLAIGALIVCGTIAMAIGGCAPAETPAPTLTPVVLTTGDADSTVVTSRPTTASVIPSPTPVLPSPTARPTTVQVAPVAPQATPRPPFTPTPTPTASAPEPREPVEASFDNGKIVVTFIPVVYNVRIEKGQPVVEWFAKGTVVSVQETFRKLNIVVDPEVWGGPWLEGKTVSSSLEKLTIGYVWKGKFYQKDNVSVFTCDDMRPCIKMLDGYKVVDIDEESTITIQPESAENPEGQHKNLLQRAGLAK